MAIEATYGWYWAVDALQAAGANVHLVAPSKLTAFEGRRVKNDQRDCKVLGDLLRAGMLPEAWISTPQVREWRELVRYRAKLVGLRSGSQGPGPRRAGQAWSGGADDRPVRCRRPPTARPPVRRPTPGSTPPTGNASNRSSCSSTPSTSEIDELSDSIAHLFA